MYDGSLVLLPLQVVFIPLGAVWVQKDCTNTWVRLCKWFKCSSMFPGRLFPCARGALVVDRTRGNCIIHSNGFKLKEGWFRLDIRRIFAKSVVIHWSRLLREMDGGCPNSAQGQVWGDFQQPGIVKGVLAYGNGVGTSWSLKIPSNQNQYMILWFPDIPGAKLEICFSLHWRAYSSESSNCFSLHS